MQALLLTRDSGWSMSSLQVCDVSKLLSVLHGLAFRLRFLSGFFDAQLVLFDPKTGLTDVASVFLKGVLSIEFGIWGRI